MENQIIKADKAYRNKILTIITALVVLIFVIGEFGMPVFKNQLMQMKTEKAAKIIEIITTIVSLAMFFPAIYLFRLGKKIIINEQMPPPNMKVIKDTQIVKGEKAKSMGRVLQITAALLILLSVSIAMLMYILVESTLKGAN